MSLEKQLLRQILEGALMAAGQPLTVEKLITLFPEEETAPSKEEVLATLEEIQADCQGRGFELKLIASGWRFQVREETAPWVNRLWDEKPQKYSRALLETLALIAYRQPITRGDIEEIRGVAVSSHIIKTLVEREWVKAVGHRDVPGRPSLYATTRQFLDYFNLKSLEELPSLGEIKDLEDFNKELDLGGDIPAALKASADQGADGPEELTEQQPAANQEQSEPQAESTLQSHEPSAAEGITDSPDASESVTRVEELAEESAFEEEGMTEAELAEAHISDADTLDDEDDERSSFEKVLAGEAPEGFDDSLSEPDAELESEDTTQGRDSLFAPSNAASVFDETD
ncbi:SMC-Scp complex subunit ScpB [Aestuariicella hydrocarbonica]|uniref:SMC-Scp complex subunit ScpB n=1 Tax=Pseudomaricurvus hydrocarbonicus TaxID=1470433 RepID=A0A9E5JW02_9GAMM|nr:SMC-Scp complex subunit ScpB [Aestuariicella hydrocarbonica]NHO65591.1 SMC-Scp complex subunit ScpB [Aestuariicella hydrocarbonica]